MEQQTCQSTQKSITTKTRYSALLQSLLVMTQELKDRWGKSCHRTRDHIHEQLLEPLT